jgi:hypothetical protein
MDTADQLVWPGKCQQAPFSSHITPTGRDYCFERHGHVSWALPGTRVLLSSMEFPMQLDLGFTLWNQK